MELTRETPFELPNLPGYSYTEENGVYIITLPGATIKLSRISLPDTLSNVIDELDLTQKEITMFNNTSKLPRLTAMYGAAYTYSGIENEAKEFTPLLTSIKTKTENLIGEVYDACLVNYYRNGKDYISFHSDDEKNIGASIASVSFGATRRFILKSKADGTKIEFALTSGTVIEMNGGCQKNWLHSVPKQLKVNKHRINFTFRQMKENKERYIKKLYDLNEELFSNMEFVDNMSLPYNENEECRYMSSNIFALASKESTIEEYAELTKKAIELFNRVMKVLGKTKNNVTENFKTYPAAKPKVPTKKRGNISMTNEEIMFINDMLQKSSDAPQELKDKYNNWALGKPAPRKPKQLIAKNKSKEYYLNLIHKMDKNLFSKHNITSYGLKQSIVDEILCSTMEIGLIVLDKEITADRLCEDAERYLKLYNRVVTKTGRIKKTALDM